MNLLTILLVVLFPIYISILIVFLRLKKITNIHLYIFYAAAIIHNTIYALCIDKAIRLRPELGAYLIFSLIVSFVVLYFDPLKKKLIQCSDNI